MKRLLSFACALALVFAVLLSFAPAAKAAELDEILGYRITVDVNDDGTLTMLYHFDWRVLDSETEGPLSWLRIGIPNSNYVSYKALTGNISGLSYSSSEGSYLRLDLDREYYEGEELTFEFELVQDYMYEMNRFAEGETYYEFTPGWFDARVDSLVIKWNSENVKSVSPACLLREDGYYTWETSLSANDTYTVSVVYPNESYSFDATKTIGGGDNGGGWYEPGYPSGSDSCDGSVVVSGFVFFALIVGVISAIKKGFSTVFNSTAGFGGASSTKKITREKIEYFDSCPGCGAPREEGRDDCQYCGKSLIKSRETVTEEQVPEEVRNKTTSGTYHYGPNPNTFLRVHVVNVPAPRVSRSGSSSRSSSCAHSSCACASHCACACACACAGGGRAGCTTKDFYNTGLKLEMLEKQAKK